MNLNSLNFKLILGITYLIIISVGLYFLFSFVDIKDLTSYEFIKSNNDLETVDFKKYPKLKSLKLYLLKIK